MSARLEEQVTQNQQDIQALVDAAKDLSQLTALAVALQDDDLFLVRKDSDGLSYSIDKASFLAEIQSAITFLIGFDDLDTDLADANQIFNAIALDSPVATVTSNGTVITLSLEKLTQGDVRFVFSDGVHTHDCTPADTVALTAGTDIKPTLNYVYILQSDLTLTVSTVGFPSAEHAPIATVLCQSAASLQTDGAYKVHAWTDHSGSSNNLGHLAHINHWIRNQNATWSSGAACTPTVGSGQFDVATSAGLVLQLHDHTFPAFNTATGSDIYVVNDPTTAYKKVGDLLLASLGQDINGTTLGTVNTDFYNLVIWGAVNEAAGDCKLFVNAPDGAYPNNNNGVASNDDDKTAIYTIPDDFKGVGFLICRLTVQENAGTYTIIQNEDLRGQTPSISAGSGATGAVLTKTLQIEVFQRGTAVTVGDSATEVGIGSDLNGWNLVNVVGIVEDKGSGVGILAFTPERRTNGVINSMLSTDVTIDSTQFFAQDGVIDTGFDNVSTGDKIKIDVNTQSMSPAPNGLVVVMEFQKP